MLKLASLKIINQTTQQWTETLSAYPADQYSLIINFFKDNASKFTLEGTPDGTAFNFELSPAEAPYQNVLHGKYTYQAIASKDGIDYPVEQGTVVILPNLAFDTDPRGYWQIVYENLLDAYKRLSSRETKTVNVLGMTVAYEDRAKLIGEIKKAETKMNQELGKKKNRNIQVRFY
jgi:hypothetical protein